jgi:hypothetical protein
MKRILSVLILFLITSCADNHAPELDFIVGTWKRESKAQYEVWQQKSPTELTGFSYRLINNEKRITETLAIKNTNRQFVYEAKVPAQNEGKVIRFIFNPAVDSVWSFENPTHDFPKKIQYQKLNANQLKVIVSGDQNSGFSYIQTRQ